MLDREIAETRKKQAQEAQVQFAQGAKTLLEKLEHQAHELCAISEVDVLTIIKDLISFPSILASLSSPFEKAKLVDAYCISYERYQQLHRVATVASEILDKEWRPAYAVNKELSHLQQAVKFILTNPYDVDFRRIHDEFAAVIQFRLNPDFIVLTLKDLYASLEKFRKKGFYENFNNFEVLEKDISELTERLDMFKAVLIKISPIFPEALWANELKLAKEKLSSLISNLSLLTKRCDEEIIEPANRAIKNIKKAAKKLALEMTVKDAKQEEAIQEIKQEKESKQEEIEVKQSTKPVEQNRVNYFAMMPQEIQLEVLKKLSKEAKLNWRVTSKTNQKFSEKVLDKKQHKFFYAIGNSVPVVKKEAYLYASYLGSGFGCSVTPLEGHMLAKAVGASFNGEIKLFSNLKDALIYRDYNDWDFSTSVCGYNYNEVNSPIFVVSIQNLIKINTKEKAFPEGYLEATSSIATSSTEKEEKKKGIKFFTTAKENVENIAFTKLYSRENNFFNFRSSPKCGNKIVDHFSSVWNSAYPACEKDLNVTAKTCLTALFKSYKSWFWMSYTRQYHNEVAEILKYIIEGHTITELTDFLKKKLESLPESVSQKGHYYQMLQFALMQTEDLQKLEQLLDLPRYLILAPRLNYMSPSDILNRKK